MSWIASHAKYPIKKSNADLQNLRFLINSLGYLINPSNPIKHKKQSTTDILADAKTLLLPKGNGEIMSNVASK